MPRKWQRQIPPQSSLGIAKVDFIKLEPVKEVMALEIFVRKTFNVRHCHFGVNLVLMYSEFLTISNMPKIHLRLGTSMVRLGPVPEPWF